MFRFSLKTKNIQRNFPLSFGITNVCGLLRMYELQCSKSFDCHYAGSFRTYQTSEFVLQLWYVLKIGKQRPFVTLFSDLLLCITVQKKQKSYYPLQDSQKLDLFDLNRHQSMQARYHLKIFFCELGMKPYMHCVNHPFFTVSYHRQSNQNYADCQKKLDSFLENKVF